MIEFSIGQVQSTPTTDWIFFSSKNAVKYFFELGYTINNRKLACIGKGTAKALRAFTDNIDFIGKNVDINLTSKQFIKIIK
ncbi:MAG: hydroxymethylbilane synthase, partial [Saprospiraceae bacterium]